jgi:hypothetical protein
MMQALRRPMTLAGPDWRLAAALFLVSLCLLQWLNGDRFQLSLDEGIYLDGASRTARGQVPYRDFFTFTGPGTFWTYGTVFRLFGTTLGNARLVLSIEIALLAAAIYWLAAVLTSGSFAAALGAVFAAFCLDTPGNLYISHRWDSNSWALLAVMFAATGLMRTERAWWIAAGISAALAAWTTPPFLILIALMTAWMTWTRRFQSLGLFVIGVGLPSIAAAAVLLYTGALGPMSTQLLWAVSHYGGPNRVPYGYLVARPQQFARLIEFLTPVLLPVIAYLGLAAVLYLRPQYARQHKDLLALLVVFSIGVLLAGLPRLGAHQLIFLSPIFWVLTGYVLYAFAGLASRWLTAAVAFLLCLLLISSFKMDRPFTETVETNAGPMRCTTEDAKLVSALGTRIAPGETLFVFPYLPIVYFITGADNPSRYLFLQPGMMTDQDEAAVEAELRAHPPKWMLACRFPPRFWSAIWPHTNPGRLEFPRLERYMSANYREQLRVEMGTQQTLILACARDCDASPRPAGN